MSQESRIVPGPRNLITDVEGLVVGNAHDAKVASGVTLLLPEREMIAAADIRGGAPGTRETDALDPVNLVERIHGLVLAGGSAYGLEAASALTNWLGETGRGFRLVAGARPVPVVPAAILFDLANGGDKAWSGSPPYARLAREAAETAGRDFALGNIGAGYGAQCGQLKGGLGSASAVIVGNESAVTVGALVAVNALGSAVDETGAFWAAPYALGAAECAALGNKAPACAGAPANALAASKLAKWEGFGANTTIGAVATDAALTPVEAKRLAIMAQDGLARALRPVHSPFDGDSLFALATERVHLRAETRARDIALLGSLAADCLARAVMRALLNAQSLNGIASYRERYGRA
jgi:L-aminopeptidase/D-esterase-like protein